MLISLLRRELDLRQESGSGAFVAQNQINCVHDLTLTLHPTPPAGAVSGAEEVSGKGWSDHRV